MSEAEPLAMCALMLEMSGFRVLPVSDVADMEGRIRDIRPYAIVADVRQGEAEDWEVIRRLRAGPLTGAARLVLMIDGLEVIPPDMAGQRGIAILQWPFPVPDLLQTLLTPWS